MSTVLYTFFPVLVMLSSLGIPVGAAVLWRKRLDKLRRSPLSEKLLRGPGTSVRRVLDDVNEDIDFATTMLASLPMAFFAMHLSQSYLGGVRESGFRIVGVALLGLATVGFFGFRLVRRLQRRARLRIGMEAEIAVGQELDQLMREGAFVFHDVPAEHFNVDHVVVTHRGVFAIETKGRMKPLKGRGKRDATVTYNGETLAFPDWTERKPIEQAQRQARWLAQWLSSAVGEAVVAKPVLVLPGWFVQRTGRSDVMVLSGRETRHLSKGWQDAPLADAMMQRIAHQIEQRCRDVEPVCTTSVSRERRQRPVQDALALFHQPLPGISIPLLLTPPCPAAS